MDVDGWHPDPYGIHEERLFAHGEPTPLVRDGGIGSFDAPPVTRRRPETGDGKGPTKPMLVLAALLITAGVVVGVVGIESVGGRPNAETTTTLSPLVQAFRHLPPLTTVIPPQREPAPPTTTLSSIERALAALPRTTTPPATTPPTTRPRVATTVAPRVTQPPKRSTPVTLAIVPATTLPLTTLATTVGQADLSWYLAYGSVFNTLQTDVEKLDRALASTSTGLYAEVVPYWQELSIDATYASTVPPVPDAGAQSTWATALADLGKGATDSIWGSAAAAAGGAGSLPPIFNQGSALITTGTTQLDEALSSVESQAAATSQPSRAQVRTWEQAHGPTVTALQTDLSRLSSAFMSSGPSDYSSVDPSWQQVLSDAQSAMNLAPIPDSLIQSYWATALNDLIQGSTDCIGSSEALPPNLFDQGVASIDSGTAYLTTAAAAIQSLVG